MATILGRVLDAERRRDIAANAQAMGEPVMRSAGGELSEEELREIDLAYHQRKVSGEQQRERDFDALQRQVQDFRARGML